MRRYIILIFTIIAFGSESFAQIDRQSFVAAGRDLLMENRYREAVDMLGVLLRADPDAHEAYFWRGIAKYNLEDIVGADADFTAAIEKNPLFSMAYQFRAITRSRLGDQDGALADYSEAIELRPDRAGPYFNRGVAYLTGEKYVEAERDFSTYIKFDARSADAHINRSLARLHLGDTLKAREDLDRAVYVNSRYARGYSERGLLSMKQGEGERALEDFDTAISLDTTYIASYFNRALLHNGQNRPMLALSDLDRVVELDPRNSLTYFNRALIRSHIGDYNRALEDYDMAALYSPDNVLVYYNRGRLYYTVGEPEKALADLSKAIELFPDFANAYLLRSQVKYMLRDRRGSEADYRTAEQKTARYHEQRESYSIYADTARRFDALLSFDTRFGGNVAWRGDADNGRSLSLRPLYKFTFYADTSGGSATEPSDATDMTTAPPREIDLPEHVESFLASKSELSKQAGGTMRLASEQTNLYADSLLAIDARLSQMTGKLGESTEIFFMRGIVKSSMRQYTDALGAYSAAMELDPANPFLYLNRSAARAEMIEFIASIESASPLLSDGGPDSRLLNSADERLLNKYDYAGAIADLDRAAELYPDFAHIYYNRAGLYALSGDYEKAFADYSRALELLPDMADAWFNRGVIQIDGGKIREGLLDLSRAGELGLTEAYTLIEQLAVSSYQ